MTATARRLIHIDRGYRGTAEVQFSDLLYVCAGLHGQLGGVDVVLCGCAVTYAVDAAPVGELALAGTSIVPPDPRRSVRELMSAGAEVLVDTQDLARLDIDPDALIEGVRTVDSIRLAADWPHYEGVWFL